MHLSATSMFIFFACTALPTVICAPVPREHGLTPEHTQSGNVELANGGYVANHVTTREFIDLYPRVHPVDHANIRFSEGAQKHLDKLDPSHRKEVEDYHKNVVKQEMEKHGAHSAEIHNLEHIGGSDPNERLHVTASFHDEHGTQIKSPWSIQKEKQEGKPNDGKFHIYAQDQANRVPVPQHWADKLQASQAEQALKGPAREAAQKAHDDKVAQAAVVRKAEAKKQKDQEDAERFQKQRAEAAAKSAQRQQEKAANQANVGY